MPSTATTGQVTLRFLAAPTDAGQGGSVSGGRILEWIDKAGFACAAGWSGRYCVTAYVGNIDFHRPVQVGDLVEVSAQLVLTGRSSMTIVVDVSSGNPRGGRVEHAFECRMVFVAVDDDGRTVEVPQWNPPGAVLRAAQAEARRRVQLREQVKALVAAQDWDGETGAHGSTLRFLAAPTDVNWGGKVHGGILMRWLDETGYVCASAWSHTHVVSRFSGGVSFLRPIRIGDLVRSRGGSCTPGGPRCTSRCGCWPAALGRASWSSPRSAQVSTWRWTPRGVQIRCPPGARPPRWIWRPSSTRWSSWRCGRTPRSTPPAR
jgi:acyl-CoA hydrolase